MGEGKKRKNDCKHLLQDIYNRCIAKAFSCEEPCEAGFLSRANFTFSSSAHVSICISEYIPKGK